MKLPANLLKEPNQTVLVRFSSDEWLPNRYYYEILRSIHINIGYNIYYTKFSISILLQVNETRKKTGDDVSHACVYLIPYQSQSASQNESQIITFSTTHMYGWFNIHFSQESTTLLSLIFQTSK
jgi:hypothetical protein